MRIFGFNKAQWREIFLGIVHGVNVSKYAKTRYNASIMKEIREGLEEGIDVTIYSGKRSTEKVKLLKKALKKGIDISKFRDNQYQLDLVSDLETVINALENGINVNQLFENGYQSKQVLAICEAANKGIFLIPYINSKMPHTFIKLIHKCLENNIDISSILTVKQYTAFFDIKYSKYDEIINWYKSGFPVDEYIKKGFDLYQIEQLFLGWQVKIDITKYANIKFNPFQMEEIRKGEESGIDTSVYANTSFSKAQMAIIREGLEANIDVTNFANPEIDIDRMRDIKDRIISTKNSKTEEKNEINKEQTPQTYQRNRRSDKYAKKNIQ